jgi:hypothetical protein
VKRESPALLASPDQPVLLELQELPELRDPRGWVYQVWMERTELTV